MALNYIWIAFFLIAFVIALFNLLFLHDTEVFANLVTAAFDNAKTGFELSLGYTGIISFFLGLMKVGENGGMIVYLSRLVAPFFNRIFPELPKNHPVFGSILMNFSANMLGLDNAATPLGLKAMKEMQELNPIKDTASNAQIMFLVLNTAGLTIIPVSVIAFRTQLGAGDPTDIFLPVLLTTVIGAIVGLITVAIYQRINLFNWVVLTYLGTLCLLVGALIYYFSTITQAEIALISKVASNLVLFTIIVSFIVLAVIRKVNVYDSFIEGAKEGFGVAISIIPYLVTILVAIGVFRASGALDIVVNGLGLLVAKMGLNTDFVPALPVAFMKPLSGSGARALLLELMKTEGADAFVSRVASCIQGGTETTFYILAVYFGSVGIKRTRYSVTVGLFVDLVGALVAIWLAYIFFH